LMRALTVHIISNLSDFKRKGGHFKKRH
jgi:hypothetical protein